MEIPTDQISWQAAYKLLTGAILPRPIGWISTISSEQRYNLAPFSFFNVVCSNPPHVLFCPTIRAKDSRQKDTLQNVRATGEFVVNIVTEELAEAMNLTSMELPAEMSEFDLARLTPAPALTVKAPRVAESPVHFECRAVQIIDIGAEPGSGSVVIGRVLHIHVKDSMLIGSDKIDLTQLKPIGRLAGNAYCRVTDIFELERPRSS